MKNSEIRTCESCGGDAFPKSDIPSASEAYKCKSCGHETWFLVHYVEPQSDFPVVFAAFVDASNISEHLKLSIKVRKVFEGKSNFRQSHLDAQAARHDPLWKFGFFSPSELPELSVKAQALGLPLVFKEVDRNRPGAEKMLYFP
jgi:hypothetical protein